MPWLCARCSSRTRWCHWCKVRHCACRPHVLRRQRGRQHLGRTLFVRTEQGVVKVISSRRYAHLKGAQKGGRTTATRPNPGRWTSDTARKAALARWTGKHRLNKRIGVRLGLRRKTGSALNRQLLRYLYSRAPRLGIQFHFTDTKGHNEGI